MANSSSWAMRLGGGQYSHHFLHFDGVLIELSFSSFLDFLQGQAGVELNMLGWFGVEEDVVAGTSPTAIPKEKVLPSSSDCGTSQTGHMVPNNTKRRSETFQAPKNV